MARRGSGEGGIFQRESDGRWVATVELGKGSNGKRLRKVVYGSTKRQVQAKLKTAQDARDKGIVTTGGNMTVSAWLDQWLDGLDATGKLKASTRRSYREVVNLYVRPHLGHIRLARLTPEDVEKMGRTLAEAGKSGNTQRLARTILRRALGQAERRGYVARNVVALTDAPAVKVDERPVLTPEQAKQLFDALHDDRLLPLYVVAIHTGLRQGELLALRWSDVDLEAGTLTVTGTLDRKIRQRTDPKTDKSRRNVPLTPQAMEALQVHQVRQNLEGTQGSDDLVFTSARGTALYDSNIRKHWHRVSANLGLALDAVAQPAPLCGHDHACPRCPHRGRVPCVRSCVHPHHRRHLWPCVAGDQQAGRGRHGQGFAMKDCRRDPYEPCIWRKPWPIPMKPPVMPGR
jgi:integrase